MGRGGRRKGWDGMGGKGASNSLKQEVSYVFI